MANKSIPQLPALPNPLQAADLLHIVRSNVDYKAAAVDAFSFTQLTWVEAQALAAAHEVIPSKLYLITDIDVGGSGNTGSIIVTGLVNDDFNANNCYWIRPTNLKAFGFFSFVATSGTIAVDVAAGIGTVTSAPVAWNTSDEQTAIDLAANINAFGLVRAVAIKNGVVIEALASGTALNGAVITPTYTDGGASTPINIPLAYGEDTDDMVLIAKYDWEQNIILEAQDFTNSITYYVPENLISALGYNPINTFKWGDTVNPVVVGYSLFFGCTLGTVDFTDSFCYPVTYGLDNDGNFSGNIITSGYFNNSIFIGTNFTANKVDVLSDFTNVIFQHSTFNGCTVAACDFDGSFFDECSFKRSQFQNVEILNSNFTNVKFNSCIFLAVNTILFDTITLEDVDASGSQILNGSYSLSLLSDTMTGVGNRGAVDVPIVLFPIPESWTAYGVTLVWGDFLTSAGSTAELIIGTTEAGASDCLLLSSVVEPDINAAQQNGISPFPTTGVRSIIATPKVEDITGGRFKIQLQGVTKLNPYI